MVGGITEGATSGVSNVSEILTNTTAAPISVTYVYSVSANGCTNGTPYNVLVNISLTFPVPLLAASVIPPTKALLHANVDPPVELVAGRDL